MPWVTRGLRDGIVTTRWPSHDDPYFDSWHGVAEVRDPQPPLDPDRAGDVTAVCPTGAISTGADGRLRLDQGACIGCGRCVAAHGDRFTWHTGSDVSRLARERLFVPLPEETDDALSVLRTRLRDRTRALQRSVHLRHVDAGSDGSEEWEIAALTNPIYDIHRLGLFLTASPRHADILLVTGIGATGMEAPLRRTREGMPDPVVVVAVGTDACSGGLLTGSYAGSGGIGDLVDVDVWVPGSPPSPFAILHGLLLALDRLPDTPKRSR